MTRQLVSSMATVAAALLVAVAFVGFARGAAAQDAQSVTIDLVEQNESGISGTATVSDEGDGQTRVVIETTGGEDEGGEAHVFANATCEDHRGVAEFYDLTPLDADGASDTVIDLPYETIANGDHWVHVHAPAAEGGGGLACGNVLLSVGSGGDDLPATGVGTAAGGTGTNALLLAGIALVSVFAAFALNHWVRRSSFTVH